MKWKVRRWVKRSSVVQGLRRVKEQRMSPWCEWTWKEMESSVCDQMAWIRKVLRVACCEGLSSDAGEKLMAWEKERPLRGEGRSGLGRGGVGGGGLGRMGAGGRPPEEVFTTSTGILEMNLRDVSGGWGVRVQRE